jgi:dTDP-4-dehydrorhamnose reductase
LGSSGQLATHLKDLLPDARYCGRETLDLAQPCQVAAAVEAMEPTAIVNAAGYTAVDKAESEPDLAWRINAESVAAAARAAAALDVPFLHVSTNYVFDGRKTPEYSEDDPPNPLSAYGATKLAGELAARALCSKTWILRTSWVFSEHGGNFVKTILSLAASRDELKVVSDQWGRPTYAGNLAAVIAAIVGRPDTTGRLPFGIYNAVGGPVVSWAQFADVVVQRAFDSGILSKRVPVRAIATSEYPTPARRPANGALRPSGEIEQTLGVALDWRKGLTAALKVLPVERARRFE